MIRYLYVDSFARSIGWLATIAAAVVIVCLHTQGLAIGYFIFSVFTILIIFQSQFEEYFI